jgi:hypothetical protein
MGIDLGKKKFLLEGHLEFYLFNVLGVMFVPSHPD